MKSFLELIKEKKKIVIGIAVAVVLVIVIICVAVTTNKKENDKVKTPIKSETVVFTDKNGKPIAKSQKDKANDKKSKKEKTKEKAKEKAEAKKKAKAWDDIVIVEEGTKSKKEKQKLYKRNKKGEIVTNKKGEKVTRKPEYAGEDDGWSPIVRPEDLEKNK